MSIHDELKRLAQAAPEGWTAPGAYEEDRRYSDEEIRFLDFLQAATPSAILALIAENEALHREIKEAPELYPNVLRIKRSSPQYSAAWIAWADEQQEIRKDAYRYRFLRDDTSHGESDFCIVKKYWGMMQSSDMVLELENADEQIDSAMSKEP